MKIQTNVSSLVHTLISLYLIEFMFMFKSHLAVVQENFNAPLRKSTPGRRGSNLFPRFSVLRRALCGSEDEDENEAVTQRLPL